jgi:hypothetical protein
MAAGNSAVVQIVWPSDELTFFRTLVDAAVRTPAFRGVSAASLHVPFHGEACRFYWQNRAIRPGHNVRLAVTYAPGSQPPATIRIDVSPEDTFVKPLLVVPMAAAAEKWSEALTAVLERTKSQIAAVDFVVTPAHFDLRRLTLYAGPDGGGREPAAGGTAVAALMDAVRAIPNPAIYTARFVVQDGAWVLESWHMLGWIEPVGEERAEAALVVETDDGRRLVLDAAAMRIAEHDPIRVENMLMNVAPLAVMKVGGVGELARLSRDRRKSP